MFNVIVKKSKKESGLRRFKPKKLQVKRVDLPHHEYFNIAMLPKRPTNRNYRQLSQFLSDRNSGVLVQDGLYIPDWVEIKKIETKSFARETTLNSVKKFLSIVKPPVREMSLTYYDPNGTGRDRLHEFYDYFSVVRVITNRENYYNAEVFNAMDSYGLSLFVTDEVSQAFDSSVAICVDSPESPLSFSADTLTFAGDGRNIYTSLLLLCEHIRISDGVRELLPEGVDDMRFLGALYEHAGYKELGDSACATLRYRNLVYDYFAAADKFTIDRGKFIIYNK